MLDAGSVFRFEITPEWILAHWPSVSTGLAQLQLEGYRVPLVTGTGQQDVAGALTYYFDARQRLQRINFVGVSGDPRRLIGHAQRSLPHDAAADQRSGSGSLRGPDGRPRPRERITSAVAPVESSGAYRRYEIEMSLERPEE